MIKHIGKVESIEELEEQINSVEDNSIIYLDSNLFFYLPQDKRFLVGARVVLSLISIHKRDIIINGQGHKVAFHCLYEKANDIALFHICQEALGTEIHNLCLDFVYEGSNTSRKVIAIRNNAYGVKVMHCKLTMVSETQVSFTVIQNDRSVETVFDREGDNFVVEGNDIRIRCNPCSYEYSTRCYGIYNDLPNSMSISNNYIYIMANGNGEEHKSIGIYNNGRFVRIVNNNIKANGYHMEGKSKEHPYVCGVRNEGEYMLFSANNCIAEWAGKAIGLLNSGAYCTFIGNKIIATHSINGISVQNQAEYCSFTGNVITSTSRNPKLLYNRANDVSYSANILKSFFYVPDCQSGCGMYFENSSGCIVNGNQIFGVKNCGIFLRASEISNIDNIVELQDAGAFRAIADENDIEIAQLLDERNINSILED